MSGVIKKVVKCCFQKYIKRFRDTPISVAVLPEISLRSPRKLFIFTIKNYIYRIKVSKNKLFNFGKKITEHVMQIRSSSEHRLFCLSLTTKGYLHVYLCTCMSLRVQASDLENYNAGTSNNREVAVTN